ATAILAADALQPLAFQVLAEAPALAERPDVQMRLIGLLAESCGPNGIAGGQALDLLAERQRLDRAELEHMFRLKTGRLFRASVLSAAHCAGHVPTAGMHRLELFTDALGVAYQIRDDILDHAEAADSSDQIKGKATYPALFGLAQAEERIAELLEVAMSSVADLGDRAEGLRWMARHVMLRSD
ncbi:MAG: polyprenyl synthetase family protein, partial [Gammaproteobacteria bacterium]|nr:polyprenyl synthetase family protein [Gammaproteobacteria bacterium]